MWQSCDGDDERRGKEKKKEAATENKKKRVGAGAPLFSSKTSPPRRSPTRPPFLLLFVCLNDLWSRLDAGARNSCDSSILILNWSRRSWRTIARLQMPEWIAAWPSLPSARVGVCSGRAVRNGPAQRRSSGALRPAHHHRRSFKRDNDKNEERGSLAGLLLEGASQEAIVSMRHYERTYQHDPPTRSGEKRAGHKRLSIPHKGRSRASARESRISSLPHHDAGLY